MSEFRDLEFQLNKLREATHSFSEPEKQKISLALRLAKKYHEGQTRKNGDAFLLHPVRVSLILINEARNKNASNICAALLHDTLEDTKISTAEIKKGCGGRTLILVQNLTFKENEKFEDYIKRIFVYDRETILVKYCDRLDNFRDALSLAKTEPQFLASIVQKVESYFLPYARKNLPYFYDQLLYNVCEARKLLRSEYHESLITNGYE